MTSFVGTDVKISGNHEEEFLGRLYKPEGPGPFRAVLSIHGGAWTVGDRFSTKSIDEALAARDIVVLTPEFRLAPRWPYPAAAVDIVSAFQWLKSNASDLHIQSGMIGIVSASSGAHLAALAVLESYVQGGLFNAPTVMDVDFLVACWPIADPLARYDFAVKKGNAVLVKAHHDFFISTETMARANPQTILNNMERRVLPRLLVLQGDADQNVTADMAQRFCGAWERVSGNATLKMFPGAPHGFLSSEPESASSKRAIELINEFVVQKPIS